MAAWDDLPGRQGEFNIEDSAFQGVEDLLEQETSLMARQLAHKAGERFITAIGAGAVMQKFKKAMIYAAVGLSIFVIAFVLLFGAAEYLNQLLDEAWYKVSTWRMGSAGDDYQTTYYEQAKELLSKMESGEIVVGNDMCMLSSADFKMILEYVVKYNEDTIYETSPERVKYWYYETKQRKSVLDSSKWVWGFKSSKYALETLSYQTLGADMDQNSMDNDFALPWQTITVLCEMKAENNYKNFGSDDDGWYSEHYEEFIWDDSYQVTMDGYFLTDDQVNAICQLSAYTYETYQIPYNVSLFKRIKGDYVELTRYIVDNGLAHYGDYAENTWGAEFSVNEMKGATYRRQSDRTMGNEGDGSAIKIQDQRIPALAPYSIYNYYTLVTYDYIMDDAENAKVCTYMTVTTDAKRFMNMVTAYIPDFTFEHFFELLERLPGSEKEVEKYKKIQQLYEKGEKAREKYEKEKESGLGTTQTLEEVEAAYQQTYTINTFPSVGVYVGAASSVPRDSGDDFTGADSVWIGTQIYRGKTYEYNDWFPVEIGANLPLNASDNLTKDQIQQITDYIKTKYNGTCAYLLADEVVTEALYSWQQATGYSISAMLAIGVQEGGFTYSNMAVTRDWNVMSIEYTEYCGYEPSTDRPGFRNYRLKYDKSESYNDEAPYFAKALIEQFNLVSSRYFSGTKQNTFFKMQFSATYDLQLPSQEEYEKQAKSFTHCYCPWWDDISFPPDGKGWCNGAAGTRTNLLAQVGLTITSDYQFPLESYTRISSEYGMRIHPITGKETMHTGIDFAALEGTPVYAIDDGKVTVSQYSSSAGNYCTISHIDGTITSTYMHMLSLPEVKVGDSVARGQIIGYVGSTGNSTGNHLHFAVKRNGAYIDPRSILTIPPANPYYANQAGEVIMLKSGGETEIINLLK